MGETKGGMKLMMSDPVPGDGPRQHWPWLTKILNEIGQPGTAVDYVNLRHGYRMVQTYARAYNALQIVQRACEAEKKGYDGLIIACASDLGMKEARSLVKIPVVGGTEATALLACTLGNKFSAICTDPTACARTANLIRSYGLGDRLAGVTSPPGLTAHQNFAMMAEGLEGQKKVVEMFRAEMRRAVLEDGAEAVYVSCLPSSTCAAEHGLYEVEGAPVVSMFAASLKLAETLVSLKRTFGTVVCKRSIYLGPAPGWDKEIQIPVD
ncbi:MAG: aspartate/glutamate racemase family protein [Syntrophaceae bacterium]|nr:aspartate/glutamate racemase family protein [Syntrophaceae bacterium]